MMKNNDDIMRYDTVVICACFDELKKEFKSIYVDEFNPQNFNLKYDDHVEWYKKMEKMVNNFNNRIGNNQLYLSKFKLEEYKNELKRHSIKALNHELYTLFMQVKNDLARLYQYEREFPQEIR